MSSGASCPGLIEALSLSLVLLLVLAHPGLLAPASLKQAVDGGPEWPHQRHHPGLLAPASLKQSHFRLIAGGRRLIRGFLPRPH